MNALRRLTLTAALVAAVTSVPVPSHAYNLVPDNARIKIDPNWTNVTIYFNRSESRAIVAGSTAFLNRAPGWVKVFATVVAGYAGDQVARGRCIKIRKPYAYGQPTFGFYTGGYCR